MRFSDAAQLKFSSIPFFPELFRSKMPEKTDEERERIAKKLAEQRAKIEGMPTTAKVSIHCCCCC